MVIWAIFCVRRKSDLLPPSPLSALTAECFKVPQGEEEGGLALGTAGPQSSCGAFVADLIRGRLSPVPGVRAQNIQGRG